MSTEGQSGRDDVAGRTETLIRRIQTAGLSGLDQVTQAVGGRQRRQAVFVLAAVSSLAAADVGMIGALVPQLEDGLRIGNTQIGLLLTVTGLVSTLAALPCGFLADRLPRLRMLAVAASIWGVVELASAFAPTFLWLLGIRVVLGAVTAVAGPTIASLTGDFFPASERGRIYGFILAGEVAGTGVGLVVASALSALAGWRAALGVLSLPSIGLVYLLTHGIEEPARGGTSRLHPNSVGSGENGKEDRRSKSGRHHDGRLDTAARSLGARVDRSRIPDRAPDKLSPLAAVRYVLKVRTNLLLVLSSAFGYFFLNGLRTFALLFIRGQYGLNQGTATVVVLVVGAAVIFGVLFGGRRADRHLDKQPTARLTVAAAGFLVGALALVPGLFSPGVALALPLFVVAGAAIAAPNAPLDAARLDIIASGLWGRAESVRTLVRGIFESLAPLAFGFLSAALAGSAGPGLGAGVNASHGAVSAAQSLALRNTFLIMLVTLVGAGLLILWARRHYLTDILTAAEYEAKSEPGDRSHGNGQARPGNGQAVRGSSTAEG